MFVPVNRLAPEVELPVDERPVVLVDLGILDDYGPFPNAGLAPGLIQLAPCKKEREQDRLPVSNAHKSPIDIALRGVV